MRWLLGLLCTVTLAATPLAAEEFPYRAIISKPASAVRSGPGKNFYATDELEEGTQVEVFRHDPGGWCAIRPPEGSFSWIRARYLDLAEESLAKVNAEDVVARIGSSIVEARDVIQVHLEKGELVELIDGDVESPGSWRKIAPPSGEFRWIKIDAIKHPDEPGLLAEVDAEPAAEPAKKNALDVEPEDYVRVQFQESQTPTLAPAGIAPEEEEPAPSRRRRLSRAQLQQEIVDIDLELSSRAAEDITTWQFDDLNKRAERALEGAPTALDRGAVRELMNKIDRFEQLCDRDTEAKVAQSKGPRGSRLAMIQNPQVAVDTSRFDGVGRLTQITSPGGAAQYALVDASGTVRYYLNAAPGMNLQAFLNKQVGVNGTRGALAAKQRQILSAQRITELPGETKRF